MATGLKLEYDAETDILFISRCPPYAEQDSEDLGDEIIARLNPDTGDIENLEILFFTRRLLDGTLSSLPFRVDIHRIVED